jgi:outer membrane protein OmpA-like peptidoglycan-associated protein
MGDSLPKAVTLDPEYFFSSDVAFRPGAQKLLNTLAALIFTLGKADCLLLPEGSAEGDVKIKSIRHAIAVNSFLETRGISKSRLEVNLTGTDIRFPKELTNISGMIIIFDYDKARLLKDSEDQQTKGPRVSLGIYPTAISIQKNEGAIVEFSVFEPPAGQPTWKFQIMEVRRDGTRLPLQEVSGTGPQYNQSYWNGRKKFFGVPYPSGKYIFSVTAMDSEGRDTTLSRLLLIRPSQEEEAGLARAASHKGVQRQAVTPSGIKTRTLGAKGAVSKSGKVLKGKAASLKKGKAKLAGKAAKGVKPKTKAKKKPSLDGDDGSGAKAAPESGKSPGDGAAAGGSSQVSYKIYFKENTISLTPNSEKRLAQVAETLGYYPMSNISLTGYSYSGEPDPDAMAQKRADYVASRLAAKYKIDRSRMDVKSVVSETPKSIVEIKLTGKEKE